MYFSFELKMHLISAHVCHWLNKEVTVVEITWELFLRNLDRYLWVIALLVFCIEWVDVEIIVHITLIMHQNMLFLIACTKGSLRIDDFNTCAHVDIRRNMAWLYIRDWLGAMSLMTLVHVRLLVLRMRKWFVV